MKTIYFIIGAVMVLLATGCASISDYGRGCRDALSLTSLSDKRKADYCDSMEEEKMNAKDSLDKRRGRL